MIPLQDSWSDGLTKEVDVARYEKGRKGETRRRIVDLASKRFRSDGIDGVGIATLMAEAGLTNGGFYAHFTSKEELVKEAIVHALAQVPVEQMLELADGVWDLPAFIDRYLSTDHRNDVAAGCPIAALSPDLGRRPPASRVALQDGGMTIIQRVASGLPKPIAETERLPRAIAVFSQMLGTLQMARFTLDATEAEAILSRGRAEALRIAGFPRQN